MPPSSNLTAELRKAAILVSSLDSPTADALLEQMSPDQAALVRRAIMDLDDIDPAEQQAVIEAFFRRGPAEPKPRAAGVELQLTSQEHPSPAAPASTPRADNDSPPPFQLLHTAEFEAVMPALNREHPQTIAVVVAHLPPNRAAEVIARLPAAVQIDVVQRLTDLDDTDPEVLKDIERGLEAWVSQEAKHRQRRTAGLQVVSAILDAAETSTRQKLVSNLGLRQQPRADKLDQKPAPVTVEPALVFEDLEALTGEELVKVCQAAEPDIVTLALAGASAAFVERIVRRFPSSAAKRLRKSLAHLGPTLLRDVEQAQQELARVAQRLANQGRISRLTTRSLALTN